MSDRKILSSTGWGDGRCKCTLRDAARDRHCRYCDPQATIDDLLEAQEEDEKDFHELYDAVDLISKDYDSLSSAVIKLKLLAVL